VSQHDPRYPVGDFQSVGRPLTGGERTELVDRIEAHPANMRAAVAGLSDEQLDTPYREGGWTARQVVHHVADSHMNSYVRFKLAVTEDHPRICTYEEKLWAELPDAKAAPIGGSLDLLDALHGRWVAFLRVLTPEDFARTLDHPEVGALTVDVLLEIYGWHARHHEAHITSLRERMAW